jgi:hypothetical protein
MSIKISALTAVTTLPAASFVPIVDSSDNTTKRMTRTNFFQNMPSGSVIAAGGSEIALNDDVSRQTILRSPGTVLGLAGVVGTTSNHTFIVRAGATGGSGSTIRFDVHQVERLTLTGAGVLRPSADNTQTLGNASFRWQTVFAGTGTINTSDEREKEWRGPLNEAELKAAKRIAAEIGIFQFIDAIAQKGEDARLHCGVKAQQVFAILEDEGLEWQRYAWCCYDEWETETREGDDGLPEVVKLAGNRYGIRADQICLWLIAAQEQRLRALEA